MKSAGKARNNGLYRHIRTSKEIIRNLLNDSINFSALIIRIWLDGMVVHPPQATKKEHGILVLNVPCSFCPLLQRLLLHKSQSFISASSRILRLYL